MEDLEELEEEEEPVSEKSYWAEQAKTMFGLNWHPLGAK
jgi:hypothetical protein